MFWNYVKIAIRNLVGEKLYSFINLLGLSIGIACFLIISLWVFDELSFDRFHENKDRIYRVNTMTKNMGYVTSSSWRLGPALKEAYPEIESYTRLWPWARSLVTYQDKKFDETNFYLADPSFFNMFTFTYIHGSPESALRTKFSVVLTKETALRYFEDDNPIGKTIFIRGYDHEFTVSGVVDNHPANSSIQFDLIGRVDLMPRQRLDSWEFTGYTYVMVKDNSNIDAINQKISGFYKKYVNSETESYPTLQPMTKVHLYENGAPGMIKLVRYFSLIAVFILLLACINFMNLKTAKATKRSIEVGVRKVVGAQRRQIIFQFLSETILLSFISLVLGIIIVELILPFFNQLTMKHLQLFSGNIGNTIIFLAIITLMTGIISGMYPALYLSSILPVKMLKGRSLSSEFGNKVRKVLTIFQFIISIGLIICVLIWQQQLDFVKNKDIGINKEFVINLISNQDLISKFDSYRNELQKNQNILSVTSAASTPFNIGSFIDVNWEGHFDMDPVTMPYNMVEYDFFQTFDMKLVSGRSFDRKITTDKTESCIINETAAALMGFDDPVGKQIYFDHPAFEEPYKQVRIIGVVKDFHAHSLRDEIAPSIFRMHDPYLSFIYIKILPQEIPAVIKFVKKTTETFAPEYPFRFEFMDNTYDRLYELEIRMGKLINMFTLIAILISCLGLFGLASYTIEKRTKEIGIRKVLGASSSKITSMLSVEFLKWVIIANLVAWPIAWYVMRQWLNNFVYHIEIDLRVFVFAGLIAMIFAILIVIIQSTKAAIRNPAEALRYE